MGDVRLSAGMRALLVDPENILYLSVVSFWETAIKITQGRIKVPGGSVRDMFTFADVSGIEVLPVKQEHLARLETLPMLHKDPFDRMIYCQSEIEGMRLLSNDPWLAAYQPRISK